VIGIAVSCLAVLCVCVLAVILFVKYRHVLVNKFGRRGPRGGDIEGEGLEPGQENIPMLDQHPQRRQQQGEEDRQSLRTSVTSGAHSGVQEEGPVCSVPNGEMPFYSIPLVDHPPSASAAQTPCSLPLPARVASECAQPDAASRANGEVLRSPIQAEDRTTGTHEMTLDRRKCAF
jgi:hypothetical protein